MRLVRETMVRELLAVSCDTSLDAVARVLAINNISGAPVVDDEGRPVGVISQSDLIDADRQRSGGSGQSCYYRVWNGEIRAMGTVAETPSPRPGVAADVMSTNVLTIESDASVEEAARRMLAAHVHRLLVVSRGKVVGLISALDCLGALVGPVH
jgi:CBS domain-containing protein